MIRRIKLKYLYTTSNDESWWDNGDEVPAEIYDIAINKFSWVDTSKGIFSNLTGDEPVLVNVCLEVANRLKAENKLIEKADEPTKAIADKWTRTVDDMPPDGLEVEVKNADLDGMNNQCYLKHVHGHWFYGYSRSYLTPTHWRRNERRQATERRDSNNRRIRDRRHQ